VSFDGPDELLRAIDELHATHPGFRAREKLPGEQLYDSERARAQAEGQARSTDLYGVRVARL
jgi:hypothetical protein